MYTSIFRLAKKKQHDRYKNLLNGVIKQNNFLFKRRKIATGSINRLWRVQTNKRQLNVNRYNINTLCILVFAPTQQQIYPTQIVLLVHKDKMGGVYMLRKDILLVHVVTVSPLSFRKVLFAIAAHFSRFIALNFVSPLF